MAIVSDTIYVATGTSTFYPALWSALAATLAAISTYFTMLVHRKNLFESGRPELVLEDWSRGQTGSAMLFSDTISCKNIKNVGKGPAFHTIVLTHGKQIDDKPTVVTNSVRIPILAPNESKEIKHSSCIWWKNVPDQDQGKYLLVTVSIIYWDLRGNKYETKYELMTVELGKNCFVGDEIAEGIGLGTRHTKVELVGIKKKARTLVGQAKKRIKEFKEWKREIDKKTSSPFDL